MTKKEGSDILEFRCGLWCGAFVCAPLHKFAYGLHQRGRTKNAAGLWGDRRSFL